MKFTRLLPVAAVVMLAAHAIPNIARALPGQPFQALREQFEEYRAPGRCTLIGHSPKTSPNTKVSSIPSTFIGSDSFQHRAANFEIDFDRRQL
jgi:hypothetical protein